MRVRPILFLVFLFLLVCQFRCQRDDDDEGKDGWATGDNYFILFFSIWGGAFTLILLVVTPIICFPICLLLPCVIECGPPVLLAVITILIILFPFFFPIYIGAAFLLCMICCGVFLISPIAIHPFGIVFIPVGGTLSIVFFFLDLQILMIHLMCCPANILCQLATPWVCGCCCYRLFLKLKEAKALRDIDVDDELEEAVVSEPRVVRDSSNDTEESSSSSDGSGNEREIATAPELPTNHADFIPYSENILQPVTNNYSKDELGMNLNQRSSFSVKELRKGDVFGEEYMNVKKRVWEFSDCDLIVVAAKKNENLENQNDRVIKYQRIPDYPHVLIEEEKH